MEKFMYVIDYWGSLSEYGGVITLIAGSDEEALTMLEEEFGEDERLTLDWIGRRSDSFRLAESVGSYIVNSFTT